MNRDIGQHRASLCNYVQAVARCTMCPEGESLCKVQHPFTGCTLHKPQGHRRAVISLSWVYHGLIDGDVRIETGTGRLNWKPASTRSSLIASENNRWDSG